MRRYLILLALVSTVLACQIEVYNVDSVAAMSAPLPTVTQTPSTVLTVAREVLTVPEMLTVDTGVPGGFVNLRSCASVECSVVGLLAEGAQVELIVYMDNGWAFVDAAGKYGYVYSDYLRGE